jgi:hypothetical protein
MAGPHLERLRAKKSQKRVVEAPSKPSKLGFEGFEGDQSRPFLENRCLVEATNVAVKNSQSATPAHPQNLQNLSTPAQPDDTGCRVEIIELPQAERYRRPFGVLQLRPPALVEVKRWTPPRKHGSNCGSEAPPTPLPPPPIRGVGGLHRIQLAKTEKKPAAISVRISVCLFLSLCEEMIILFHSLE